MNNAIINIVNWDRRYKLCKSLGYGYAIIYQGTHNGSRIVACNSRLRTKEWANQHLGAPCTTNPYDNQLTNTHSKWYQGYMPDGNYVIAFQQRGHRDYATLL